MSRSGFDNLGTSRLRSREDGNCGCLCVVAGNSTRGAKRKNFQPQSDRETATRFGAMQLCRVQKMVGWSDNLFERQHEQKERHQLKQVDVHLGVEGKRLVRIHWASAIVR
ncbi:hypothetical protein BD289DRAFT_423589 [Coniella lustricola]|uniref:Uncharacterized protein n=1 Tax=Coniella lustricola TaxID=2025994 RepID=A0A2T3AJJ4_9PEZI|nr:hypothetical protein BD289DRAFT_423589 [Coniella lustricola]